MSRSTNSTPITFQKVNVPTLTRSRALQLFLLCLSLAYWKASTQVKPAESDVGRYETIAGPLRELLDKSGDLYSGLDRQVLRDNVLQIAARVTAWNGSSKDAAAERSLRTGCDPALLQITAILDRSAATERFWLDGGGASPQLAIRQKWPVGGGVLILHVGRKGAETDILPQFISASVDLAETPSPLLQLGGAPSIYAIMFFENAKPGINTVPLRLKSNGTEVAKVAVNITVPPAGHLKVSILDETGKSTAAVGGLYAADHRLAVPANALKFDEAGYSYRPGRTRAYQNSHYWPGSLDERQVFFVDGSFSIDLPAGNYKLILGKGFEYAPSITTIRIEPKVDAVRSVTLQRWIDMPARGWYSGDTHVHYARVDEAANQRLAQWGHAEDLHVINVMEMGDALKTYFPQYAFGAAGRKVLPGLALVPGQEDPRTAFIGHTLQLNIQKPVRHPEQYYLYDLVFDEIHRQGGLTGYAHTYQPPTRGFWVREDMSINIARNKIDFVEIGQNGEVDYHLFYEFLNLGFRLAGTAGSDVPYSNTIGTSRVYAYTGSSFTPDAWFAAIKAGRTFVTAGPVLELTVNGQVPGSEIHAQPGDKLRVHATASGYNVPPRYVEVVAQGDVIKSAEQASAREPVSVDFTIPVRHSTWIGARCAGAVTSPVYIRVGKEPFWKLKAVPELIATRLNQLHDVEVLSKQGVTPGSDGGWNGPAAFQNSSAQLVERAEIARKIYLEMLDKAKMELSEQEASH